MYSWIVGFLAFLAFGVAHAAGKDSFGLSTQADYVPAFVPAVDGANCSNLGDFGVNEAGVVYSCKSFVWTKSESAVASGAACGYYYHIKYAIVYPCEGLNVYHGCPSGYARRVTKDYDGTNLVTGREIYNCYKT